MKISQLIIYLNKIRKDHGDLPVLGVAPEYQPLYDVDNDNISVMEPSEYVEIDEKSVIIGPN